MAFKRFRKQRDPEGRMSLGDHLRELRRRVIIATVASSGGLWGVVRIR